MALDTESALDNLARMVQVIGRDQALRQWFSALTQKSAVERRNEIFMTGERMRAEGKDTDLVAPFRLLADSKVFDAARLANQEYDKNAVNKSLQATRDGRHSSAIVDHAFWPRVPELDR
jgi:hypothetical protein